MSVTVDARDGEAPVITSLTVTVPDDAPDDVRRRGVNSGVMRRIESRLGGLLEQVDGTGRFAKWRQQAEADAQRAVAALIGRQPRGDDDYYRDLLRASRALVRAREDEPLNVLSERLGIPKGTAKSRLAKARDLDTIRMDELRKARAAGARKRLAQSGDDE
ncbi:hypothetical protein [Luteipulveratus mongoliensis]|uniref:hypothetical protein n=1 Tax=Luteipulveratus mongoliensis TaxID=571913 RepID=UPI0012ED5105|nr:hypothetical protein [Luteipulveratus mongoliensis]